MTGLVSMFVNLIYRIVRILIAEGGFDDAVDETFQKTGVTTGVVRAYTTWTHQPYGRIFSAMFAIHTVTTAAFYVKGSSALRRVAASEYHVHPDVLRLRPQGPRGVGAYGVELSRPR
jgi:hypothetical protein